ncbi:MAG: cytochrome C [Deltaproteobacteria bacterium]|nr:cytochrome C [Deltaproteobacteria bacterium]
MGKTVKMATMFVLVLLFVTGYALAAGSGTVTYEKDVKKILSENCLSCHGSDAPTMTEFKKDQDKYKKAMKGPRVDTYANLMVIVNGSDTGALMRRLDDGKNTKNGKPGNMYTYLGGTDAEKAKNLEVIKKWVGGWTLKRKKDMSADELKAIKALEK